MTRYFVQALLFITLVSSSAAAATLFGRVIEINDGDVITVFNLNRPVRIRLLAVDAPEENQPFGDVARKHLSDLVYDKSVLVEYWGIAADGSLVGRVTLNNTDIGAQMIRDGVAWFDVSNQGRLSVADREIYQQSEQAARSEKRGLWQADAPVAPWEFVRARALRRDPAPSMNSVVPVAKPRPDRQPSELTSLTLMASKLATSAASNTKDSDAIAWAASSGPKNWQPFKPAGENFTALIPDDGEQKQIQVPFGDQMVDVNVYAARDGWALYALMWITGPTDGESDRQAISSVVRSFFTGFADGYQRRSNSAFTCELESERRFSIGAYSGSEYDLPSCTIPARLRAYTRVVGRDRQMYVGVVFYTQDEDTNVSRFMKSFTIAGAGSKTKSTKR